MSSSPHQAWPPLPYDEWAPTKRTLHRCAQIVGKVRMALVPPLNHWWHVTLLPTVRGLTTGPMPAGEREVEIAFDLVDHRLVIAASDGHVHELLLAEQHAVRDVYRWLFAGLRDLGVDPIIRAEPYDLGDDLRFGDDAVHRDYDPAAVARFQRVLAGTHRALTELASGFNGKASPIQFFWHSFDLAHQRFSGRPAPVSADVDAVTAEAYSHELISFGFWPGDDRRTPYPAFYSYTAPEPYGIAAQPLQPAEAEWQDTGRGWLAVLPYDAVRTADDPHATLLAFYESAYHAGASLGDSFTVDFRRGRGGHGGAVGAEPAPAVRRLLTIVDLDDRDDAGPDARRMAVKAWHYAELADRQRILLLGDRGWMGELRVAWRAEPSEEERRRAEQASIWATETLEDVTRTARMVVGPDEPDEGRTHADMERGHWETLASTLRRHGIEAVPGDLKALPHDVEPTDRVLERVGHEGEESG